MPLSELPRSVVWVVDDSSVDRQRAQRSLEERYQVESFSDGSAILERLASHEPPNVMVLDWVMPGVSGIDVVRFLRANDHRVPEVPILLLTSQQRPDQIIEGLDAGANDYLSKPYAPEELQARVAALLRSAALYDRAARAERAVREMALASPDSLLALDAAGNVIFANSEAGRVFGCAPSDLIGKPVDARFPELAGHLVRNAEGTLGDVESGGRVYEPSVRALAAEEIQRVLALRDVTERRQIEARRLDLYSIVAHDLRSPLGALLLRAQTILEGGRGEIGDPLRADMEKMRSSCNRMVAIIDDFLDLASLDADGDKLRRETVDLQALCATVSDDLRPLAAAKQMSLELSAPVGRLAILGDHPRLGQVISNLVGNAIKFSPPNSTVVVAGRELPDDDVVEVSVADQGPGIPAAAIATLFDRFVRADSGTRAKGTGLGLMIVRQIAEAHGGSAGVESRPGTGSRFWVRLPRAAR